MPTLYQDRHVALDEGSITIFTYYLPLGRSKHVPYVDVERVEERSLIPVLETLRLWGGGMRGQWLHWDPDRPFKDRQIVLVMDAIVNVGLTPDDHDRVLALLRERISAWTL